MKTEVILSALEAKHPGEKEYLQAVKEVLLSIEACALKSAERYPLISAPWFINIDGL